MRIKDVRGFEGHYAITDDGHLISLYRVFRDKFDRVRGTKTIIRAETPDDRGYVPAKMYAPDRPCRQTLMHIVVAEHFCEPYKGEVVNHLDGNRANNRWWNLEWCSHLANVVHGVLRKERVFLTGEQIDRIKELSATTPKNLLAEQFDVSKSTIDKIVHGDKRRGKPRNRRCS